MPPAAVAKKVAKVYTHAESAEHLAFVESLMLTPGVSQSAAIRACRSRLGFGESRYLNLKKRVLAAWALQDKAEPGDKRAAAIRRIEAMLAHARGEQRVDPNDATKRVWTRPPNHPAVRAYEDLLARLQGTFMPIEVNVTHTVSNALQNVMGNLTEDQLQDYMHEYLETKRLAEERRAELIAANNHAAE